MSVVATTETVVERITKVVHGRLLLLVAGYLDLFAVSEVVRPTLRNNPDPVDRQIILTTVEDIRVPELDCPGNPPAEARQLTLSIHCRINPSEKDTTSADEYCNGLAGAVRIALCSTGSQWHTMDGLAVDSRIGDYVQIAEDGSFDGVSVPLQIIYRISENDPFEVRA